MSRCDDYRDLLEVWTQWWNGPGREGFKGFVLPPLTPTAEALNCTICAGVATDHRCKACGRNLEKSVAGG